MQKQEQNSCKATLSISWSALCTSCSLCIRITRSPHQLAVNSPVMNTLQGLFCNRSGFLNLAKTDLESHIFNPEVTAVRRSHELPLEVCWTILNLALQIGKLSLAYLFLPLPLLPLQLPFAELLVVFCRLCTNACIQ